MAYTLGNKCAQTESSTSTYHQKCGRMFFETQCSTRQSSHINSEKTKLK